MNILTSQLTDELTSQLNAAAAIITAVRTVVGPRIKQEAGVEPPVELLKLDLEYAASWLERARDDLNKV